MNKTKDVVQPLIFEPITLTQKEKVEAIRRQCGNTIYIYTFASLYAWQEDEQYEICFCGDAFLVKNGAEGENAYLFPCGSDSGKRKLIDTLLSYEKPIFVSMTQEDKAFLEEKYPHLFDFTECRNEFIYIYDKEAQVELKGKAFKRVRHQINSGRSAAKEWKTEVLTNANAQRALAINQKWAEMNNLNTLADTEAARCALEYFSQLSMWGLIFKADGKDTAYIAGSFITPEIFDLSFCKVLDKGCDFFVRWAFYSALPQEVTTIDSEEDLGIEGLRINKLSRQPKELIHIWKGSFKL